MLGRCRASLVMGSSVSDIVKLRESSLCHSLTKLLLFDNNGQGNVLGYGKSRL